MPEKEPQYFKEFREHIDKKFYNVNEKIETHVPAYFKEFQKHIDEKYATKADLELMETSFKQHVTDLASGFNEKVKGVCDQVAAIDEKLSRVEGRVIVMDQKLITIGNDVLYMKGTLKEKTDKKDTLDLKRRVICLEAKIA